jgi:hypothetical protein
VGILGFAVSGIAVAGNGNPPPGQGECGHGNSEKPCKDDPQPDRGKDCEEHGNHGGVNEDHCNGETTPTETTTTETTTETTTTETSTTETSTTETTPPGTTPTETTSTETTPSQASSEPGKTEETNTTAPATVADEAEATESNSTESKAAPGFVGLPPVAEAKEKPAAVRDAVVSPSKPTRAPQQAPFSR